MALQIFRLSVQAETTTTTGPEVSRYFYTFEDQHRSEGTITIPFAEFVDDSGDPVTDIAELAENNGYYQLYVNGVLQQEDIFNVDHTGDEVTIDEAGDVPVDAPIILIVTNFDPESETTVTT